MLYVITDEDNQTNALAADALAADVCPICQDAIKDEYVTECNHKFCDTCITAWFKLHNSCPYCRKQFYDISFVNVINQQLIYEVRHQLLAKFNSELSILLENRFIYDEVDYNIQMLQIHNKLQKLLRLIALYE
jgi:hypothetical protein